LPAATKKQRTILWSSAIGAILLIGGIANACDPNTPQPSQPVGNIGTITTDPFTTTDSATTDLATTIVAPPPDTETQQEEPVTQAAPPPADTEPVCGSNSYRNSDGQCVHDPVAANSPPPGATAQCNDGTYSFSKHHSGTCSGHHGVAVWLN
jgi:hypothetical protein